MPTNKRELSSQRMLQDSYDITTGVLGFEELAYDGTGVPQREISRNVAFKITLSGSNVFIAKAPINASQASATWQARKIATSGDIVGTWSDSGNFSQVATDLTALSYS